MRNKIFVISFLLILIFMIGVGLNIKVITKQGVNYHVSEIELPLYLKVLNFYDRHFNYKWLAKRITNNLETKEEKVFRLFQWTHETIRPQPESLPVMDDHVGTFMCEVMELVIIFMIYSPRFAIILGLIVFSFG